MRHFGAGLLLTGLAALVSGWWWGGTGAAAAAGAGLLAAAAETGAMAVLRPALQRPFEGVVQRWAAGLVLRLVSAVVIGGLVLRWPGRFPALPTATGFLMVLIPLLFGEMWLVATKLRAKG
jgi:O-antigen/teichoic acid export membrane protein